MAVLNPLLDLAIFNKAPVLLYHKFQFQYCDNYILIK